MKDVEEAHRKDDQMTGLIVTLRTNDGTSLERMWRSPKPKPFARVKEELTVTDNDLILRGTRLVVPKSLQMRAVEVAHRGHQGIVKTKQLMSEKVWFPDKGTMIEDTVRNCEACQCTVAEKTRTPLQMTSLPDVPWQSVVADFASPLPGGKYLLVVVNEYSRFLLVVEIPPLNTSTVTSNLFDMLTVHGIPDKLKSDNGPPFFGKDFSNFLEEQGVRHHRVTPLWPEANVERSSGLSRT
ncbi:uncharacterized protein K02A2.6-like [Ornithodoros turicata]|uniref:uncharacterized protein K02A2.6-like n=1 Tax=Ornithodoros turicata TaxID=34597 RepID=UPI0031386369